MKKLLKEENVRPASLKITLDYDDAKNTTIDRQILLDVNSVSKGVKYTISPKSNGTTLVLTNSDDGQSPKDIMDAVKQKNYDVSINNGVLTITKKIDGNPGESSSDITKQAKNLFHTVAGVQISNATTGIVNQVQENINRIKKLMV